MRVQETVVFVPFVVTQSKVAFNFYTYFLRTFIRRASVPFVKHLPQSIGAFINGCPTIIAPNRKPSRKTLTENTKKVAHGAVTFGAGELKPPRLTVVVIKWQKKDTSTLVTVVRTTFPPSPPPFPPRRSFVVTLP